MQVIDPGHIFKLHVLDQKDGISEEVILKFVKREGLLYPGNVGHHPGTILQEAWRAEIARLKYVDNQVPCDFNKFCITNLRQCIYFLEIRAAQRHATNFIMHDITGIEDLPTCPLCGHVFVHTHDTLNK